jgi:ankyrin repeat protein
MIAAYKGHQDIVELLIEHEADVTLEDSFGKRALDRSKTN